MNSTQLLKLATRYLTVVSSVIILAPISFSAQAQTSAAADSASPAQSNPTPAKPPLEGKVDHDENLAPLGDQFAVGKKFDPSLFGSLTPDNVWIPKPDWFAGKFHSDTQNVKMMYFYKTGQTLPEHVMKEVGEITGAEQKSKDGQYWNYAKVPRTQVKDVLQGKAYLRAVREDLISVSDAKLVLKFNYFQIIVDDKGTIIANKQVQSINTYTPLDDNLVLLRTSLKSFDGDGQPEILQHGEKIMRQIEPYHQIDEQDGENLKQLFVEFLKKTGHEDIIPVG